MQIRRLRLTGFKSFVEPTELRIEPGLTGVVGPNGCGKSNLLEAIRWVMGESSPKSMRGGGMEDVIFAGTATRPARDFAEVALVCDTEGETVASLNDPGAGHDLEVIRRIERGAGSAYRANGRDVRAKDVALIFADAATGAHSPALVSQGKIAGVIAAKPAERRAMLEEAAGIAGLHVRRKDAEQKLRATETNLARLSDLVGDMEVRANALRRQARAAERYKKLTDDIRLAEARLIYARWQGAATAADQAKRDLDAAETAVTAAQADQTGVERAQHGAAAAVVEARGAAQALRDRRAAAAQEHVRLSAELAALDRRIADIMAERARIAADRGREGDLARQAYDALGALDTEQGDTARAIKAEGARRAAIDRDVTAAQSALRDAEVSLAQTRARAASETADRRIAESALANARQQRDRAQQESDAAARQMAALDAADTLAAALVATEDDVAHIAAQIAAAEAELTAAESARDGLADELAQSDAGLAEARAALAALDGEASTLSRALAHHDRAEARALDRIRVNPGYEAALAAALGDDLDAAIGAGAARGWQGADAEDGDPALPTGCTPLAHHVAVPPELARRIAQVGVAELDSGQRLAVGQRLVTTSGRLRRWDGFVSDGDGATAAQRLVRQNRLDAIAAQRPQVELGVAQLADRRMGQAAALAANGDAIADARRARAAADQAQRTALRAVDAAQAALDRRAQAETLLGERQAGAARALAEAAADEARLTTERDSLPDGSSTQAMVAAQEAAADAVRSQAQAAQAALADHERALSGWNERAAVVAAEIKGWKARAGEAARRIEDMDRREGELAAEAARIADSPGELAAAIARLDADRAAIDTAVAEAEAAEHAADAALRAADARLTDIREALSRARETRAGAVARSENAELRRIEMGRLSGERFECPPPLLPQKAGFDSDSVAESGVESARHDQLIADRERLGPVNLVAADELAELDAERIRSAAEIDELQQAVNRLRGSIGNLNREGRTRLLAAFETVNGHFERLFSTLFNGGQAHLELVDSDDPLEAGLEIMAQPPGKRLGSLTLLSGGEQALTAIALIFALFLTNPAPICVLDEVDAPLDDANIERFCDLLDRMTRETRTRYLIVTHNAVTMARMHRLFGVTMIEKGVSRLVSVDLGSAEELLGGVRLSVLTRAADHQHRGKDQQPRRAVAAELGERVGAAVILSQRRDLPPQMQRSGDQRDQRQHVGARAPQRRRPSAKRQCVTDRHAAAHVPPHRPRARFDPGERIILDILQRIERIIADDPRDRPGIEPRRRRTDAAIHR
ncbi:MAG: hypothetical protein RLZZ58_539, partial [Pseudomonadota bacterium]